MDSERGTVDQTATDAHAAPADSLADFAADTQLDLWTFLDEAVRRASDGEWSIEAGNIAQSIIRAIRLIGPTDVAEVPWLLTSGGVYEALVELAGSRPYIPDGFRERFEPVMAEHGQGSWSDNRYRMAGTVAAIRADAPAILGAR